VPPAESVRIMIFRPDRYPLGNCVTEVFDDLDVVGNRVGTGVAGPQQGRQRLTGAQNPVVQKGTQRMEPEALLPRWTGVFLL
jgi:hypothetical protein